MIDRPPYASVTRSFCSDTCLPGSKW